MSLVLSEAVFKYLFGISVSLVRQNTERIDHHTKILTELACDVLLWHYQNRVVW